jgi:hypothetical protein
MSFVQRYIIDDSFCECPVCGADIPLYREEINSYNSGESISIICFECLNSFYLEKDND